MNAKNPYILEVHQQKQRILSAGLRRGFALIGAIGVGLLMVGVVLALNSYQVFHAAAEQINLGVGVSGSYSDTFAAEDSRRVIREGYITDTVGGFADDPATLAYTATWPNQVNYVPYLMPQEGGIITRVAIYVFQPGNTQIRLALYSDADGIPHYLLTETQPLTATTTGWLWFNVEPQSFRAGERFWIAHQVNITGAELGWKTAPPEYGYRYHGWVWGNFPQPAASTWTSTNDKSFHAVEYVVTQYDLDVVYTVTVTPTMDAYTLTVQGLSSGESFAVTADSLPVGSIIYSPTTQMFFSDDMESGDGGWMTDLFTRTITDTAHYSSPVYVWWVDEKPYLVDATLTSTVVALPTNVQDMRLQFWHYMNVESEWDGGWLEYRSNDGAWGPWTKVERAMFISGGYPLVGYLTGGWTGSIPGQEVVVWIPMTLAGQSIQWRWRFMCDPYGIEASEPNGWWIDDVRVKGIIPKDVVLTYTLPLAAATDGEVEVRFQDTITDSYQDLMEIDLIEVTGLLNNRPPTLTLTTPNGGEHWSGTRTIEWSGSDVNRDVITYNVYLSTNGGVTWTTSLYQVSFGETETPITRSWDDFDTTAFSDSDNCLIRVEASDGDGSSSDQSDAAFTIDNTPPNGTVTIDEGDYTPSRDVHLTLGAPGDTIEMYLDGDLVDAPNVRQWIAYTTAVTVTLTADEGSKVVTVRYRDVAMNEGDLASDTVIYDITAPTLANETPADGATVTTGTLVISATVTDVTSGIDSTAITMTVDSDLVAHTYDEGSGVISYTPSPALSNALHSVALLVQDRAGNIASWEWNFSVDEPPASVLLTANPASIVANGVSTTTITATVRSNSGHTVVDGTEVVFTTTMGALAGGAVYTTTTQGGVAHAVLTASETDGVAMITAKAGVVEGMVEVLLTRFRVYLPIVVSTH